MFWVSVETPSSTQSSARASRWSLPLVPILSSCSCLFGPLKKVNEASVTGTFHRLNFGAVLIDFEGGHALDACCLSGFLVRVYVDLLKSEHGVIGNFGYKDGADSLARWAPRGGEIDNEGLATVLRFFKSSVIGGSISKHHISMVVCHRESFLVSSFNIINTFR